MIRPNRPGAISSLANFVLGLSVLCGAPAALVAAPPEKPAPEIIFQDTFDDPRLNERGWYDGEQFTISEDQPHEGLGCLEYRWKAKKTNPDSSSGVRRLFEPSDSIYLRFAMRLSTNWGWTGRDYHPHLMQFLTTENGKFDGPAATHLTVYVEPWNGRLRLATQDIQNKDAPHGLTQGSLKGGFNGRSFDSDRRLFDDDHWHVIEAFYQLNTLDLAADKPKADGIVRGWVDGKLVIDRTDIVLRSTDYPKMQFNQFLMMPYFGPTLLPHAQTLWIDEMTVAKTRPASAEK